MQEYLPLFQRLVSKLLTFCIPTIAIIRQVSRQNHQRNPMYISWKISYSLSDDCIYCSGHAVEAVCKLSLARDYRLMSTSHGYIFMNEVSVTSLVQ